MGVAYTVATGRTLHASREILAPHGFRLPQVFKNGVMIWDPATDLYSHRNFLTLPEVDHVLGAIRTEGVTPFVFTLESGDRHAIHHPPVRNGTEERLARAFGRNVGVEVSSLTEMPASAEITNISALGDCGAIRRIEARIDAEPHLVAYAGTAWEGEDQRWIDIHHTKASKGGAIDVLREQLGARRIVCFGDGDNDLSMFERADESYAPESAPEHVREAATAVIGRHDEDGVADFLRERFGLDRRVGGTGAAVPGPGGSRKRSRARARRGPPGPPGEG